MRKNSEIISIIRQKLDEKEMSISELARQVGMSKSTISRYMNESREFPVNKVNLFAKVLNLEPEYILGFSEKLDISSIYNQLHEPRQQKVYTYAERQLEQQEKVHSIKVYGQTAAGTALEYDQLPIHEEEVAFVPKDSDGALIVRGNSMFPLLEDGELLFFEKTPDIENCEIAVVEIKGEAVTTKKVCFDYEDKKIILRSINPEFKDMVFDSEDVRIIGRVLLK